ncbi:tRNA uridine 5-carboxymethylaminomethyl modification enzyme [Tepidanaerobacter acetatoxydans Re1]|uniref:tRNA uridine 5-carboxymethylaminomethyl modification enzyme MnmG n=1 Tax=Tepidanaerobacter acetatoxydans (strain DSM 21804 / JCM 16047 / Re1) TaxID=1209989 RepID=F4LV86_TEPAE|nr:tRNA uridine-5-carboxymethylaminomethyl(34) synthesis enzyme MnmG [Tepidanaerobacter acetatoxydans]AEE92733.1 tRNA uridine 5-carboxymethylaminomethyl modification enzyme mnmG [Tepidanaerobacter acetatoxydans Re1]CCP27717.1 tRNA uridine 5-carboxymethylaminomethyl modification enzyme [Tepidanaerobacter acetatoxydans Re1]
MDYSVGKYDVAVVGIGHAGCEAALATARMGLKTVAFAINLDSIALMACNPSIGGPGKGNMVREIDALGGQMAINVDKTFIQVRMLNTKKGPAVRALRAQLDKRAYCAAMKYTVESQENLDIVQEEVVKILVEGEKVKGVVTKTGGVYEARAVILTTGVYLRGRIVIGDLSYSSGPSGLFPANELSKSLESLGLELGRFKTGTPPRIHKDSVDFSKMIIQPGDDVITPFSYTSEKIQREQVPCWLTYTNETTHKIIAENLHRAPLYTGEIKGVGPRYCPSVEMKIVNFKDKKSHQIFIEPEGNGTREMYVQGLSTSLPADVQIAMTHSVKGLENAKIMRFGYAIEYDFVVPTQLKPTLETKAVQGLYMAGQINGTSGYEEAAAQGLIAGINAALKIKEKEPLVLSRSDAYIGVLIDDLVTKGVTEPYRILTSRAEYRLLLRQDNADLRLMDIGHSIGLISDDRYEKFLKKKRLIDDEIKRLKSIKITPTAKVNEVLTGLNTAKLNSPSTLAELLKRPELDYEKLKVLDEDREQLPDDVIEQVEIATAYEGYIERQMSQVAQFKKMENKKIPDDIDYDEIYGLGFEAREKLKEVKPISIGQASRISGVNPSDVTVLLIYLETKRRKSRHE